MAKASRKTPVVSTPAGKIEIAKVGKLVLPTYNELFIACERTAPLVDGGLVEFYVRMNLRDGQLSRGIEAYLVYDEDIYDHEQTLIRFDPLFPVNFGLALAPGFVGFTRGVKSGDVVHGLCLPIATVTLSIWDHPLPKAHDTALRWGLHFPPSRISDEHGKDIADARTINSRRPVTRVG